jgi:UDP-N-acetylmuramate dehydrogenase
LADALGSRFGAEAVRRNEPLARYTALRIGGPADLLSLVEDAAMLHQTASLAWHHGVPFRVLGNGSNVLVSDHGVGGLVVLNRARAVRFAHIPRVGRGLVRKVRLIAESGASTSTVARQSIARGLAGLEWAIGIPGTIGGAVIGNAGAWGGDVASVLIQATILEPGGTERRWPVERFEYGYRSSVLKHATAHAGTHAVVLAAEFGLQEEDPSTLDARVAEITTQRRASQPGGATCGSVFKNPPGDFAGRLIEAAGLKGQRSGAAEISSRHANFIINHGGATAADVQRLIDLARQTVQSEFGVTLELEIERIGRWQGGEWENPQEQTTAASTQGLVS